MQILSPEWQNIYLDVAKAIAQKSKDASSQVGAVLVRPDKTVASLGFNGFPQRIADTPEWLSDPAFRPKKYPRIVHAEANALNFNRDYDTRGFHLIVTHHPCDRCALRIASTGVQFVYYQEQVDYETRWAEAVAISREILKDAGVVVVKIPYSPSRTEHSSEPLP